MKFQTKTGMMTAHWNDVQMAVTQGSVAALTFPGADKQFHYSKNGVYTYKVNIGKRFSQQDEDFFVFITSFVVMVTAALLFGCSLYRYKTIKDEADEMMKEPLIVSTGISA